MGKGTIISYLGNSKYYVYLQYDSTGITDRIAVFEARIADIDERLLTETDSNAISYMKLLKTSYQKQIVKLNSITTGEYVFIWSTRYDETLTGTVPIAEAVIEGGFKNVIDIGSWSQADDGWIRPTALMTPASAYYNYAMLAGTEKWKPSYREGTIYAINYTTDKCAVVLTSAVMVGLNVNQTPLLFSVSIEYPPCNSRAFEVGDKVLVQFSYNWNTPKVIGFTESPVKCAANLIIRLNKTPLYTNNIDYADELYSLYDFETGEFLVQDATLAEVEAVITTQSLSTAGGPAGMSIPGLIREIRTPYTNGYSDAYNGTWIYEQSYAGVIAGNPYIAWNTGSGVWNTTEGVPLSLVFTGPTLTEIEAQDWDHPFELPPFGDVANYILKDWVQEWTWYGYDSATVDVSDLFGTSTNVLSCTAGNIVICSERIALDPVSLYSLLYDKIETGTGTGYCHVTVNQGGTVVNVDFYANYQSSFWTTFAFEDIDGVEHGCNRSIEFITQIGPLQATTYQTCTPTSETLDSYFDILYTDELEWYTNNIRATCGQPTIVERNYNSWFITDVISQNKVADSFVGLDNTTALTDYIANTDFLERGYTYSFQFYERPA